MKYVCHRTIQTATRPMSTMTIPKTRPDLNSGDMVSEVGGRTSADFGRKRTQCMTRWQEGLEALRDGATEAPGRTTDHWIVNKVSFVTRQKNLAKQCLASKCWGNEPRFIRLPVGQQAYRVVLFALACIFQDSELSGQSVDKVSRPLLSIGRKARAQ